MAAQICAGRNREVAVALTPVGQGRFEIYLDGAQLYDRKHPPQIGDAVGDVRGNTTIAEQVRTKLLAALAVADAAAPAR